jgi:hypothetical protein
MTGEFCHKRRIKCRPSSHDTARCQNCSDFDIACVFSRSSRRKRVRPQEASEPTIAEALPHPEELPTTCSAIVNLSQLKAPGPFWKAFAQNSVPSVKRLLKGYHETIFPMYVVEACSCQHPLTRAAASLFWTLRDLVNALISLSMRTINHFSAV